MKNYIFGTGPFAIEVAKRLEMIGIEITSFLKLTDIDYKSVSTNTDIPITFVNKNSKINSQDCNIVIAKKPMIMGETIDFLRSKGFKKIYVADERMLHSDQNDIKNLKKYIEAIDLRNPFLNYLETNIVDQCNLNCKGCAHFSNIYNNNFIELEQFQNDLKILSKKFNVYYFRILGGEPLLHPRLKEILSSARMILNNTRIAVVTNGLLISQLSDDILQSFVDNDILMSISLYQPTFHNWKAIKNKLNKYGIDYLINDNYIVQMEVIQKFQTRLSTQNDNDGNKVSQECTGRFCRFLRDGKITKCYYPLLVNILNKRYGTNFQVSTSDYIQLDSINDGWSAIDKLNGVLPFCNYCSEKVYEVDWEGYHKNDKDINSFVLKK